jgi:hypothetical protein
MPEDIHFLRYRADPALKKELQAVWAEARRLGTDEECFAANHFGMTLSEYRIWCDTGETPTGWRK